MLARYIYRLYTQIYLYIIYLTPSPYKVYGNNLASKCLFFYQKEEKDAAALAVATVVDAGTLYQQAAANSANSQEQAHSGCIPGQSEEVIEVDGGNKPVISKVKLANLNLW